MKSDSKADLLELNVKEKGEVALTPSDTPYTFLLRRGTKKDVALEIRDLLQTDVPMALESKTLGIKLVTLVLAPPAGGAGGGK